MKHINLFYILFSFALFVFSSCSEDEIGTTETGILRLGVTSDISVTTKADHKIQLAIRNKTDNWSKNYDYTGAGMEIELKAGGYEVIATSGTDNNGIPGFEIPYYKNTANLTISAGKSLNRTINCTLANTRISVNYGDDLKESFAGYDYEVVVTGESGALTFGKEETRNGYFSPGNLSIYFRYKTGGEWIEFPIYDFTAKIKYHYKLNLSLKESGIEGNIGASSVQLEIEATNDKDAYVEIKFPRTTLKANAWAKFAYLKGEIEGELPGDVSFEWRKQGESDWNIIPGIVNFDDGTCQAILEGLDTNIEYEYRIEGGNIIEFTTEDIPVIPNMGFEDWIVIEETVSIFGKKKIIYPADNANNIYWSTGNKGVIIGGACNTIGVDLEDGTGKYAQLTSSTAVGVFAAGNIFTGVFDLNMSNQIKSAKFGQPYSSRPTKLKGKFKYTPKTIDKAKDDYTSLLGEVDMCEIYVRLFTGDMYSADQLPIPGEIAYGTFSTGETISDWTSFEIPIVYNDLEVIPERIAIVATSSKYGAFFTGGLGSELCIDDFELSFDYDSAIEGE